MLTQLLTQNDPLERLRVCLSAIDRAIADAQCASRPDTRAIVEAIERGSKLVEAYHAMAASTAASITTLDRKQAIAELREVLAAWEDPRVSDEAWLASRTGKQAASPAVVRRKKL